MASIPSVHERKSGYRQRPNKGEDKRPNRSLASSHHLSTFVIWWIAIRKIMDGMTPIDP